MYTFLTFMTLGSLSMSNCTSSERSLGFISHSIGFIQDNKLESRAKRRRKNRTILSPWSQKGTKLRSLQTVATRMSNGYDYGSTLITYLNTVRVLANVLICSRTTSMPRSSEAFSCGKTQKNEMNPGTEHPNRHTQIRGVCWENSKDNLQKLKLYIYLSALSQ